MFMNKAIICGNLTRDPELRYIPTTGAPVASFSVATNRVWTNGNGEKQEDAEFHNVVVFGRVAESSAEFLKKGQVVLVEGRLRTRSFEVDGMKRYRTEIIAERVQFGPKKLGDAHPEYINEGIPEGEHVPF